MHEQLTHRKSHDSNKTFHLLHYLHHHFLLFLSQSKRNNNETTGFYCSVFETTIIYSQCNKILFLEKISNWLRSKKRKQKKLVISSERFIVSCGFFMRLHVALHAAEDQKEKYGDIWLWWW